ncbi:MAG: hypothetical protein Q9167_005779 [Letrouitia subvulpina]
MDNRPDQVLELYHYHKDTWTYLPSSRDECLLQGLSLHVSNWKSLLFKFDRFAVDKFRGLQWEMGLDPRSGPQVFSRNSTNAQQIDLSSHFKIAKLRSHLLTPVDLKRFSELLCDCGVFLWAQGQYTQSEELAKTSIQMATHSMTEDLTLPMEDDIQLSNSFSNVAVVKWQMGDLTAAGSLHEKALSIKLKYSVSKIPFLIALSYDNVGRVREQQSDLQGALDYFSQGYKLLSNHPIEVHTQHRMAQFTGSLGRVLAKLGETEQAQERFLEALRLYEKSVGVFHTDAALAAYHLGSLLMKNSQLEDARLLFKQAKSVFSRPLQPSPAKLAAVEHRLYMLYQWKGDVKLANEARSSSLQLWINQASQLNFEQVLNREFIVEFPRGSAALSSLAFIPTQVEVLACRKAAMTVRQVNLIPLRSPIVRVLSSRYLLRQIQPPVHQRQPTPRLFTQNSALLLIARTLPRPELPFLYDTPVARPLQPIARAQFRYQLARLLTTERKRYWKHELKNTVKYIIYIGLIIGLVNVCIAGIYHEKLERAHPTPPEWSFWSRHMLRSCIGLEDPNAHPSGLVNWAKIDSIYRELLRRLDDPSKDGKGLLPIEKDEKGQTDRPAVGQVGLDLSSKSEPWRRGYHTALMGAARAAEHLDGWVTDTTMKLSFPKEVVVGPSNPRPQPVPYGAAEAPREENCIPSAPPPETFYLKILTSAGFSTRQRLDAALAYADWLDFKGLSTTAEEMYGWGLDIAMGALPQGINNVVDTSTGIISNEATFVSTNILDATNALAVHHARNRNLAIALPIFLSGLRARRNLSIPVIDDPALSLRNHQPSTLGSFVTWIKSVIISPPYPPAPVTGDEAPIRTRTAICKEAAIMAHIGEILFASSKDTSRQQLPFTEKVDSSSQQRSGLSWTRDAVDISENTLLSLGGNDKEAREKCAECLGIGMENWSTMVHTMLENEKLAKILRKNAGRRFGWFWNWASPGNNEEEKDWEREEALVQERMRSVRRLLEKEEWKDQKNEGTLWMLFK